MDIEQSCQFCDNCMTLDFQTYYLKPSRQEESLFNCIWILFHAHCGKIIVNLNCLSVFWLKNSMMSTENSSFTNLIAMC